MGRGELPDSVKPEMDREREREMEEKEGKQKEWNRKTGEDKERGKWEAQGSSVGETQAGQNFSSFTL